MAKPNLFIVGAQRSGTTALHRYLQGHPDIFMCEPKEPHFFSSDLTADSVRFHDLLPAADRERHKNFYDWRTKKEYLALFKDAHVKVVGESSAAYLFSKDAAKNIFDFNPKAKIIIMLRDPVYFIHSYHFMLKVMDERFDESFADAYHLSGARKRDWRLIPFSLRTPSEAFYVDRIRYFDHVRRFLEVFPASQVKVILFADFVRDTPKVYADVLHFLGVDASFSPDFKVINANRKHRFSAVRKMVERSSVWPVAKRLMPDEMYKRLTQYFYAFFSKRFIRSSLSDELRMSILADSRKSVFALDRLLLRKGLISKSLLEYWPAYRSGTKGN